jgi:flagellar biosynthesis/type III secretory pathway M-ring protein FliF/YscJ
LWFLHFIILAAFWMFVLRVLALWVLHLTAQQRQQRQQRQQQRVAAVTAERDREWREMMAERTREVVSVIEAQEGPRRGKGESAKLLREYREVCAKLESIREMDEEQHFRAERGSLLWNSEDEDEDVVRGLRAPKRG